MTTTKKRLMIALIGIAILAALVFAAYYGFRQIPSLAEQLPPGSTPIQVRITHPDHKTVWPLNVAIPIQIALKAGEPVTSVELFVNGTLYDTQPIKDKPTNQQLLTLWEWQPGLPGTFILVARALDASGNTGISQAVLIEAGPPSKNGLSFPVEDGQTWENISQETGLELEEIQQANPDLDPILALIPGSQLMIPTASDPVKNPNLIPGYGPLGDMPAETETLPVSDMESKNPPKWNFINDIKFFIKNSSLKDSIGSAASDEGLTQADPEQSSPSGLAGEEGYIPPAPEIVGHVNGCTVDLSLHYLTYADFEDGYFIYRSREGGEFERIVTLPPYGASNQDSEIWKIEDPDQYGVVSYYAATFNVYGESAGTPISFLLDQTNCISGRFGLATDPKIDELGDLVLPFNVDTAYLYLQINDSQAIRVPEGDRMFLPGSGVKFNLDLYLDSLVELRQFTDMNVHLEIWGWQGGELVYVGDLDRYVHRTVLSVCSVEGEGGCTDGGVGDWVFEMNILPDFLIPLNEQKYEIRWQTSALSETDKICLALANEFYGPGLTDSNPTLLKICYYSTPQEGFVGGNQGTYLLDLEKFLYPEGAPKIPPYSGHPGDNYQYPDFAADYPQGEPFQLAVRVLSVMEESGFNDISNTVYMHHLTQYEDPDAPPLASKVPSMYEIEILEDTYQPPAYEIRTKWACVIIDEDPSGHYSPGQEVCPLTYVECGVNMDCEDSGFLAMVGAAWDLIVNGYHEGKQKVADGITKTIPFCDDSQRCKDAVKKGVDYAVTYYTGIPANLPNSDEAAARGVTMVLTSELSSVSDLEGIEYLCGDYCEDQIGALLNEHFAREEAYKYGQPGCYDLADHYGYFPICFAPPTIVHASPGSGNFPGFVMVRVTRKDTPESINASEELKGKTQLKVTVDGFNDSRIGEYADFCTYQDNLTVNDLPNPQDPNSNANRGYGAFGDSPMEEPLFETVQVEIPWLEPGQSIDIPVSLKQIHNQYNQGCIRTAHSQYLFYQGRSHLEAAEYCYSEDSTQSWVPCNEGGSDIWDFDNPAGP